MVHPQVNHRWAIEHASEVGFYWTVGVGVVVLLIVGGLYLLAENALQMVATIFAR